MGLAPSNYHTLVFKRWLKAKQRKSETKEKQVPKSKTSDREFGDRESGAAAGVTKEAKTVSTSHETNLNVLIIVAGGLAWFLFR